MFRPLEVFPAQHLSCLIWYHAVPYTLILKSHVFESLNQVKELNDEYAKAVQNGITVVDLPASDFDEPRQQRQWAAVLLNCGVDQPKSSECRITISSLCAKAYTL